MYLKNCRYYFVSPYARDATRIEAINDGLSQHAVSRADVEAANTELKARLAADGWLAGHEEYRTVEDRTLHGGLTRGPEGRAWLKNDVILDIGNRRMDDPVPGEEEKSAGKWIQFIELWQRSDYPGVDRLVFAAPQNSPAK
jgi:hypothetical protein